MLTHLDGKNHNILTVEKSADYQFEALNQSRVDPLAGFTFAKAAAAFLALDPDAVMIEEIPDHPTARAALELAVAGSLVLAGISATTAPHAIAVLLDMGLQPYPLAATLRAVIAQRTLRRICPNCKQPNEPAPQLLDQLGLGPQQNNATFYTGQGCPSCANSGYAGTVRISQTLWPDQHLTQLLRQRPDTAALQHAAQQAGMKSLQQLACEHATNGLTSLQEIARTCK